MTAAVTIPLTEDSYEPAYLKRRKETDDEAILQRAEAQVEAEGGFADTALAVGQDVVKGVFQESAGAITTGVVDAATEFSQSMQQLMGPALEGIEIPEKLRGPGYVEGELPDVQEAFGVIRPDDAESTTGTFIQKTSQFLAGFLPLLKATKGLGAIAGGGKMGSAVQGAVAGAIADPLVFDEHEQRLSNLLAEVPALKPIVDLIKANPDDPILLAKARQVGEGILTGFLAEGFVQSVRFLAKARGAKSAKAADKLAVEDVTRRVEQQLPEVSKAHLEETLGAPKAPLFRVTKETVEAANAFTKMEDFSKIPEKVGNIRFQSHTNINRINGPDDVRQLVAKTAKVFEKQLKTGKKSNTETVRLAEELSMDPDRVASMLATGKKSFNENEVTALRFLMHGSGAELKRMGAAVASGAADDVEKGAFLRQFAFHELLMNQVSAGARSAGRTLQAFNIAAESGGVQIRAIRELLQTQAVEPERLAQMVGALETPGQLNTFIRQAQGAKGSDMFLEAWINGLLSGPQTHAVNTTSNSLTAFWMVPERALAAQIRRLTGGSGVEVGEATAQLYGMARGAREGIRLAGRTLKTGQPSDVFSKVELRMHEPAITGANAYRLLTGRELEKGGQLARAVDLLGETVRVPTRALGAEDEFFKAVGYRMELNARAFRQASSEGLQGDAMAKRMQDIVAHPPEDLRMAAIDASRYQTFTKPLGEAGAAFQRGINKFPPAKVLVPFLKTTVNLAKFAGERTPFAPLSRAVRAEIRAGGARRDLALSKIALGSLTMSAAADLSSQGLISGAGPADPGLRAMMHEANGWQEFSFKLPNGDWVSYNRLDPLGQLIGIAATATEILTHVDEAEADDLAVAVVLGTTKAITSKTYMRGMSDFLNIFDAGVPGLGAARGKRYLQSLVGSLVPNVSAQANRTFVDPQLRQVETYLDAIKAKIPGLSKYLLPQLNVWGEPRFLHGGLGPDIASPLWVSPKRDDVASKAFVENGIGLRMPSKIVRDVELDAREYNKLVKLAGNDLKNPSTGLGAHDTIEAIVTGKHSLSGRYQTATDGPEGGKSLILRTVVSQFRQAAQDAILQRGGKYEIPRVREAAEQKLRKKAEALRG